MTGSPLTRALWILLALASPLVPLHAYLAGNWYSVFHDFSLGMVFGILSYCYFLNVLVLSARIRLFDRLFGHDRVMVFHGWMALLALACGVIHHALKEKYFDTASLQIRLGSTGIAIFEVVIGVTILLMARTALNRLPIFERARSAITRMVRLDYTHLKLFHNLTAAAALIISVHVFLASSTNESHARRGIMAVWALAAISLFVYHKAGRVVKGLRGTLIVKEVVRLSETVTELRLSGPASRCNKHRPGQFGYFRFVSKACGFEEHPFTISSAPSPGTMTITVKNLGDYTARLARVGPGDKALFDGPYGVFTPRQDGAPHLFVAGGIGITPFLAIIDQWGRDGIQAPVTLLWSVRRESELIHRELFDGVAAANTGFRFIPVITAPDSAAAPAGRIDAALIKRVIEPSDRSRLRVYLCGPDGLMQRTVRQLANLGIPRGNLRFERFSL